MIHTNWIGSSRQDQINLAGTLHITIEQVGKTLENADGEVDQNSLKKMMRKIKIMIS